MGQQKMFSCDEVHGLMTPYVDREASAEDRAAVERHLGACRPCAAWAKAEEGARRILALRGRSLRPQAPAALRNRCASLAAAGRTPHRVSGLAWWLSWRPVLATATALFIAVGGVLLYGGLSGSSTVLAAEMALDHIKCFAFFDHQHPEDTDPRTLEARLEQDYGWRLSIPAGDAERGLRLTGARRCLSTDGTVAHVMYRHADRPVSLFVVSKPHATRSVTLPGSVSRVFTRGGVTYVLVMSGSEREAAPVIAYFEGARGH